MCLSCSFRAIDYQAEDELAVHVVFSANCDYVVWRSFYGKGFVALLKIIKNSVDADKAPLSDQPLHLDT